jgi:hypothetical protein
LSIVCCTQDLGFIQFAGFPQIIQTQFHISKEEHQRRCALAWPGPQDDTITVEMPALLPPPEPTDPKPPFIVNPDERKPPRRKH